MTARGDSTRTVEIRPTERSILGLRGHEVTVSTSSGPSSRGTTTFTIEGTVLFVVLVAVDIYLLAISGRFSAVPRELVRWIGGVFIVGAAIVVLLIVISFGIVALISAAVAAITGNGRPLTTWTRLVAGGFSVGLGALLGTSVIINGPSDFSGDALLIGAAAWLAAKDLRAGRRSPGRRLLEISLAIAGVTGAIVGVLLLRYA